MPTRLRSLTALLCLLAAPPCFAAGPLPRAGALLGAYLIDAVELTGHEAVRPNTRQVLVLVPPGGPAFSAGLRSGDILMRLDGRDVPTDQAMESILRPRRIGEVVNVEVSRDGVSVARRVTLQPRATREECVAELWPLASGGDANACLLLARCYYGPGEEIDPREALRLYRRAAEMGHAAGECGLGVCHLYGIGTSRDARQARSWFRKAARRGLRSAQGNLAACLAAGVGGPVDMTEAVFWWRRAAEQGDLNSQVNLGSMYMQEPMADPEEGMRWLRRAAEHDFAFADYLIGVAYARGDHGPVDLATAATWFRRAAEQGMPLAQSWLGRAYRLGEGVTMDVKRAVYWYQKAAEAGEPLALLHLAFMDLEGVGMERDVERARAWLLEVVAGDEAPGVEPFARLLENHAVYGDGLRGGEWRRRPDRETVANALWALGDLAVQSGPPPGDMASAMRYYRQAAERGSAKAQLRLGSIYGLGLGVQADPAEAARWMARGAEGGCTLAMRSLASLYRTGTGVEKDAAAAERWLTRAAELGDAEARLQLAECYLNGIWLAADHEAAIGWLCAAAGSGQEQAAAALMRLSEQ